MDTEELAGLRYIVVDQAGSAPPLLLLHKTGGDERELLPFAAAIAPGSPVIAVRGPVSEDGKLRFFRRLSPGVFDEDDLGRRAHDLAEFVEAVTRRHALGRLIAVGLSNGANIAAAMMLLRPRTLDGAILLRPAPPFHHSPAVDLKGLPVLIVSGASDATVPETDTVRLANDLRERGAAVDLRPVEAGHRMTEADTGAARLWLSALRIPAMGHSAQ
jgi:phospholipase/carboxylesterase